MDASSSLSSPIEGFVVQKWMRDRKLNAGPRAATVVNADRRADLQLIFRHLDVRHRGKISLDAIRGALGMVALSEDLARHTHLAESVISCFQPPGRSQHTGGAVDFKQFNAVMSSQEQGRTFPTLQDELKSDGSAAVVTHFANLFRREVVVREMLDRGGTDHLMCSTFKELFKATGLAATAGDRVQKLRLLEGALKYREKRAKEGKRAALARQKMVERSGLNCHYPITDIKAARDPAVTVFPSTTSLKEGTPRPAINADKTFGVDRIICSSEHGLLNTKPLLESSFTAGSTELLHGRGARFGLSRENEETSSFTEHDVRFKREASREASAVLGLRYVPRAPPKIPTARLANAFRRRGWWRGHDGIADDWARANMIAVSGGFVRCPPPRVLRLRRRLRRCSVVTMRGSVTITMANEEGAGNGVVGARLVSNAPEGSKPKSKCPLLRGRRAFARLPSWASCDRSVVDPELSQVQPRVAVATRVYKHRGSTESLVRQTTTAAVRTVMEKGSPEASVAEEMEAAALLDMRDEEGGSTELPVRHTVAALSTTTEEEPRKTSIIAVDMGAAARTTDVSHEGEVDPESLPAIRFSSTATTAPPVAAQIPTAMTIAEDAEPGRHTNSSISISQPPTTYPDNHDSAQHDACRAIEGGDDGQYNTPHQEARRPWSRRNDLIKRNARGGKIGSTGYARDGTRKGPPPTPWRSPRVVRCMQRPDPGGDLVTQKLHNID